MPTTKKENFYFGLMMCTGMVIVMTFYNLFVNGLVGTVSVPKILLQMCLGFLIAFLLELFIVGPVAHRIAFALPYDKSNQLLVILSISICMVTGMVLCMSLYGLGMTYLTGGLEGRALIGSYFSIALKNFVFAFPLQLLLMGPLVRYLFKAIKRKGTMELHGS
ncbi:hypothetical protein [Sediminibacillus massiliensis]|uniref:hypothetical protein n=1 Tax=Sediminibacillus massiliensis TaxID=1926277 RepID=UPI0009884586|nr:hypothetical protein [Sediminibacillus massiliensis]